MFLLVCILVKETLEVVNVTWLLGIWLCHKNGMLSYWIWIQYFRLPIFALSVRYGHWWTLSIKINHFMFYDREMDVLIKMFLTFSRNWKLKMNSFRVNTSWVEHYHWLDSVLSWWSHFKMPKSIQRVSLWTLWSRSHVLASVTKHLSSKTSYIRLVWNSGFLFTLKSY